MKKNSITVTWYTKNYGSILQAFALQKVLNSIGLENKIVNYMPDKIEKLKFFLCCSDKKTILKNKIDIKKINKEFLSLKEQFDKYNKFDNFNKEFLNLTKKYTKQKQMSEMADIYDYYFCGSDQIWNPSFFKECQFLQFVSEDKPKIAYAPSIGTAQLTQKEKNKIKPLLERFNAISIRERQGADLLKDMLHRSIQVVCDPVFLLTKEKWIEIFKLRNIEKQNNDRYILCYFLGKNNKYYDIVNDFSKKVNLKIKTIPNNYYSYKYGIGVEKLVGPIEWLDLIYNAEYVFTDSFHATAFSLIFNINFYTLKRFKDNNKKSQNTRIYHLLNKVGLNDRIIEGKIKEDISAITNKRWKNVNKNIEEYKNSSLNWLRNAIKKEE